MEANGRPDLQRAGGPRSESGGLANLLRALRYRNYRLYFLGQGTSLIGTWLTRVATAWLVYRLTGSAFALGLVSFAGQLPVLLFAPFAGVVVDRYNRYRILLVTQVLSMLQSAALAALTLPRIITVGQVIMLSIIQGLINAFDMPARQSLVIEMVENREDLPNAIALNSSMVNAARLLGPSIAGVLIAAVGEGLCFTLDALSYVAVVIALLAMRLRPRVARQAGSHLHELREGLSYAFGFRPIRWVLLLLSAVSIMSISYTVLMPIFAQKVLKGGPQTLGFLMAASGFGAVMGALYLASRRSVLGLGRIIPLGAILLGSAMIGFAFSKVLWFSLAMMLIAGLSLITHFASGNTILQTIVDDDKRGRIMALFGMAFLGMAPVGSLLAGVLASRLGPATTVAISGACCIAAGVAFARKLPVLRSLVRPVYVKRGILPETAAGLQSATELRVPPET